MAPLSKHLVGSRHWNSLVGSHYKILEGCRRHTVKAGVVRLNMRLLDFAVLNDQRVALATVVSENRSAVKLEVQRLRKGTSRVSEEADLIQLVFDNLIGFCCLFCSEVDVRRSCRLDPAIRPTPS